MAKFHVGQRVRIILRGNPLEGREATIWEIVNGRWADYATRMGIPPDATGYRCDVDGLGRKWPNGFGERAGHYIGYRAENLAPLTDPQADAFLELIKKLGKEPVNDAPKVGVTK